MPLVGLASRDGAVGERLSEFFDLTGVQTAGDYNEPDIEAIAALSPDLIVGHVVEGGAFFEPSVTERLEQIAPVVYLETFAPVSQVMAGFGALLGVDAEGSPPRRIVTVSTRRSSRESCVFASWTVTSIPAAYYSVDQPDELVERDQPVGRHVLAAEDQGGFGDGVEPRSASPRAIRSAPASRSSRSPLALMKDASGSTSTWSETSRTGNPASRATGGRRC
ncbi:MAG: hypothetical protein ACT4NY_15775 [Pseudonocardiales bacterium]